jgi:hypothetical protein
MRNLNVLALMGIYTDQGKKKINSFGRFRAVRSVFRSSDALHHRRRLGSKKFPKGILWVDRGDNIYKEIGE